MDMNGILPSRRAFLTTTAAASGIALAGCLGGSDDSDGTDDQRDDQRDTSGQNGDTDLPSEFALAGDGTEPFSNWIVPDNPIPIEAGVELVCQFDNYQETDDDWEGLNDARDVIGEWLQVDPQVVSGELYIGPSPELEQSSGSIILGDFEDSVDDIVETFEQSDEGAGITDEYGEYTIVANYVAIGPDAILETTAYEEYIDAYSGEGERLVETDDDAALLFDLLPAGPRIAISRHDDFEDLAINGETHLDLNEQLQVTRSIRAFVFEDDGDASLDRAREIMEEGNGYEEVMESEESGRVVMVEYEPSTTV